MILGFYRMNSYTISQFLTQEWKTYKNKEKKKKKKKNT